MSEPAENPVPPEKGPEFQQFTHNPVAARVPEKVARGVYSTGQLILDSPKEFVIDFIQSLTRPHQVVGRVVVTPATMEEFAAAFAKNLENYASSFGPPPTLPTPSNERRPTIQEIYDNLKLPDDILGGTYANTVLIGHSQTEFFFDFITGFFPTSAVTSRVYIPAPQAPRFLNSVKASLQQYQTRYRKPPESP